jgi:transposase
MLSLPPSVRVLLCTQPTDMRRSFDRLAWMAEHVMRMDPYSGHLFVFRSRRGDRVKILYWDRSGLALWYKRLERGVFAFPVDQTRGCVEVEAMELAMLLEGIELSQVRRRKRFRRSPRANARLPAERPAWSG